MPRFPLIDQARSAARQLARDPSHADCYGVSGQGYLEPSLRSDVRARALRVVRA
jgi:hypothetical protein